MLFLVKSELKGSCPLPPDEWRELVIKYLESIMEYKKQGKEVTYV